MKALRGVTETRLPGKQLRDARSEVAQTYAQMPRVKDLTTNQVRRVGFTRFRWAACRGVLLVLAACIVIAGCDTDENPLRPYEGERPFIIQSVTQSWTPDVQWVGGRAAAIGLNRGKRAALDSTLVWLRRVGGDDIDSPITINDQLDAAAIAAAGGEPLDSLEDGVVYTLWIASEGALDVNLDSTAVDEFMMVDSTFEASYMLSGRSGGGVDVSFTVVRNQTLLSDNYILDWTPADVGFRQLAIREASSGGFTDLRWHVVIPEGEEGEILPPVVIGNVPEGAVAGIDWGGWGVLTHTIWATTEEWDGESFGFRTPGYAFFQAPASNFE